MSEAIPEETKVFATNDAKTTDGESSKTVDGFDNFVSRLGLNNNNTLSAGLYVFNLMTRNRVQLEAAYRGSWIVGQVVDCVAEDMTRAGIDISTNESEADIKDMQSAIAKYQIWASLCRLTKWGRLYGGAIGVMQIEGQDLSTPLKVDTVAKGQFQGVVVYDRWMLNPDLTDVIRFGPDTGLPLYYYIVTSESPYQQMAPSATGQVKVHHSRVIRGIGIELPFWQAVTEMMWGESVLERMWDRLIAFDSVTMSTANLIERANNRTIGIEGYRQIIAAGGKAKEGLIAQLEAMREFQTNEGLTVMDKNDTFATTNYSFGGLSDVMLQFAQQLSGASQIPMVRIYGQSPAGLNSTGENDLRIYYDKISAEQESRLRPGLDVLLRLMWQSVFGKPAPKDLEFTFVPLWQMSALDKSTVAKTNTETIVGAYEAGLTDRATGMKELRQSSGDTGLFQNISDEDIQEAEEELPPQPEDIDDPKEVVPSLDHKSGLFKNIRKWFARDEFKESDHPRKNDGKFGQGSGGASAKTKSEPKEKKSKKSANKSPAAVADPAEASAVRTYTGALSSHFIEADRGGEVDPDVKKKNETLNSFLEKAPKHEGTISRGIVVEKGEVDALLKKYAEGSEIDADAKQSWTKDPKGVETRLIQVAREKKNPVKVFFEYPDSKTGVDVSGMSRFPEEEEVIIPKGSKYKVASVEKVDGGYRIKMAE